MAHETHFLVQSFKAGKGGRLIAEPPLVFKTSERARNSATSLAATKLGVVAYATSGDAELGDYDEPDILFKAGKLPAPFDET